GFCARVYSRGETQRPSQSWFRRLGGGYSASTMHAAREGNSHTVTATASAIPIETRFHPVPVSPPGDDARRRHPLFLRWALFQSVMVTLFAAAGLAYGGRLHGASLVVVPLILAVLAVTSGYAGLLAWRCDEGESIRDGVRH